MVIDVDEKWKMKIRLKLENVIYTKMGEDVLAEKRKTPVRFTIFTVYHCAVLTSKMEKVIIHINNGIRSQCSIRYKGLEIVIVDVVFYRATAALIQ